jgi:hypothetical protein
LLSHQCAEFNLGVKVLILSLDCGLSNSALSVLFFNCSIAFRHFSLVPCLRLSGFGLILCRFDLQGGSHNSGPGSDCAAYRKAAYQWCS